MAVTKHKFLDILSARKANRHVKWIGEEPEAASGRLLSGELIHVGVTPKFQIRRDAKAFAIGSCFARNIERRLASQGVNVATLGISLPPESYASLVAPNAVLNKYNTHSIESEVLSAFGEVNFPNMGLIEIDGGWWDPLAHATHSGEYEHVADIRRRVQAVTRQISDCDLVIITLGLNEVWFDDETGVYLNGMPPREAIRRSRDRFSVILSDVEDNVVSLTRTIECMRANAKPGLKVVITVSPVPMSMTLTGMDVILANTFSKSMLRVCAQVIAEKYDFVDYFPSYEIAINSPPELVWAPDRLHVADNAVGHITGYFIEKYLEPAV